MLKVLVGVVKGSKIVIGILCCYWLCIVICVLGIVIGKGWFMVEDGKSFIGLLGL